MSFHEVTTLTALRHAGRMDLELRRRLRALVHSTRSALNHNSMGRGYETFGNGTAETLVQAVLPPDETSHEWYRPDAAAGQTVSLVGARQRELHGNRGARGARS